MISVEEAKELIIENSELLGSRKVSVDQALDFVLFENIYAPLSLPSFNQSAMDGYAIRFEDYKNGMRSFRLVNEVKAGDTELCKIQSGETFRIFTGAMVPKDATMVIMQERVESNDKEIVIKDENGKMNLNIRSIGEQINAGDLALKKGAIITPATIGFLYSLGISEVLVYAKPKVSIIVTGNELKENGTNLALGEIYESNSGMLKAALQSIGISAIKMHHVKDDYESTVNEISKVVEDCDVLLLTGGISVGDYDFVGKALNELGVKEIFYKVKQKPGKPLFFGKLRNKYVFALPGNPAAALVGFYEYLTPSINVMIGKESKFLNSENLKLLTSFTKKGDRSLFLKAKVNKNKEVELLEGQSSFILSSFSEANALVYIPGEQEAVEKDSLVETHFLPNK